MLSPQTTLTPSAKPVPWLQALVLFVALVLAHASALAQATVTFFAGTPLAATDGAGNLVWKETYRPYGERLTHSPASSSNSVWFTSKPQDPHTGLVYMGARYYDPVIGRFMGTDPVGFVQGNVHSVNRYAYANNNPYRFVDPDGRQAIRNFPDRFKELLLDGGAGGGPAINDALEASGMAPVSDAALAAGIASGSGAKSLIPAFGSGVAKGLGDLTPAEVRQIQRVVNEAGRPLEVVGSAAAGTRRGVGTNLPLGKGPGTRSDIDYVVPPSSLQHFEGLQGKLPSIDPKTGIIPGVGNTNIGPVIRFEPR